LIDLCKDTAQLDGLCRSNAEQLGELRAKVPNLRNAQRAHFADLLIKLMDRRRTQLEPSNERGRQNAGDTVGPQAQRFLVQDSSKAFGRSSALHSALMGRRPHWAFSATGPAHFNPEGKCGPVPDALADSPEHFSSASDGGATAGNANQPAVQPVPSELSSPEEVTGVAGEPDPSTLIEANGETLPGSSATNGLDPTVSGPYETLFPSRIARERIDKSRLRIPIERRLRDKKHLKRVSGLPCLVCNRQPSHAHHLRFAQRRGMSQKVSDEFVVPLCALHHGDLHQSASEKAWWSRQNIDPVPISSELWAARH
jgi:hypothetical protein